MNYNKLNWQILALFITTLFFTSCSSDDDNEIFSFEGETDFFVLNEGNFTRANSTLSRVTTSGEYQNLLFSAINSRPLGDVFQSMTIVGNTGYLVVNNSDKVEVINLTTFKSTNVISEVTQPRYMQVINDTLAYITQWGNDGTSGQVAVTDLRTGKVTDFINTGGGSEGITLVNGKIYIANNGGSGNGSTIYVVDPTTNTVETTISVTDKPSTFAVDKDDNLWVACKGYTEFAPDWSVISSTNGALVQINTSTNTVIKTIGNDLQGFSPSALVINDEGDKLYYSYSSGTYAIDIDATTLPTETFLARGFLGLGFNDGNLYGADAKDFASNGEALIYNVADTSLVTSYTVGLIPNGFVFP